MEKKKSAEPEQPTSKGRLSRRQFLQAAGGAIGVAAMAPLGASHGADPGPSKCSRAKEMIHVATYTGGLVGPTLPMVGHLKDGGTIIAETAPSSYRPRRTYRFWPSP